MDTYFSLEIDGAKMDFISMNVSGPKLFQVFYDVNGKKERFHMQGNGIDSLSFVFADAVPDQLLQLEPKIRDQVFLLANRK